MLGCEGELNTITWLKANEGETQLALPASLPESCVAQRCLQLIWVLHSHEVGVRSVLNTNKADIVGHQDSTHCFDTVAE